MVSYSKDSYSTIDDIPLYDFIVSLREGCFLPLPHVPFFFLRAVSVAVLFLVPASLPVAAVASNDILKAELNNFM
jgi:hypothetical protein